MKITHLICALALLVNSSAILINVHEKGTEGSLIMVVGWIWADSWDSQNGSAQIVDLLEKTRSCQNIKKYPINVEAATGAVVSGQPMICGGWLGTHNFFECFQYSKTSNNWTLLTSMTMKRAYSASVSLNGKLWVTGGFGGHSRVIQASTEYVSPDGDASQPGPSLPSTRYGHCAVKLSTGQVMLLGGYSGENLKSVIIFDPDTERYDTSLPSLKYDRSYVGCAVFNSAMHDNREVVLAVGGLHEATAEVLDHTQPNAEWTEIAELPTDHVDENRFYGATAMISKSGQGAIVQMWEHFYELTCKISGCSWKILPQKLSPRIKVGVMMNLPSDYTC